MSYEEFVNKMKKILEEECVDAGFARLTAYRSKLRKKDEEKERKRKRKEKKKKRRKKKYVKWLIKDMKKHPERYNTYHKKKKH